MFDDPGKELKELEKQLLKEEEWFARELDSAKALLGDGPKKKTPSRTSAGKPAAEKKPDSRNRVRNYANDYGKDVSKLRKNPDLMDEEEEYESSKSVKGLVILAVLETLGIVGIVAYWLIVLL